MNHALRVDNLARSFGPTVVLHDLSLHLGRGDRLIVVGYSGSGKTTLLRLIAGLDTPTAGEVSLGGKLVSSPGRLFVLPEQRRVAMVFQGLALFPHLRALDQIAFAARGKGGRQRAEELLARVGLAHRANAPLDELSGGERQRIALARALAQEPDLLLMDEPFASLDDRRRAEMRALLRALLDATNTTLVLVTHAREDVLDLARRVLVLDAGRAVAAGTLADVLARPRHVAAVRCLALGELIEGTTDDGRIARTPFGDLAIGDGALPSAGRVCLLVRPGQPRLDVNGVEAEVLSIDVRPPETAGELRHRVVVRAGDATLPFDVRGQSLQVGQRVRVTIDGPCAPVAR